MDVDTETIVTLLTGYLHFVLLVSLLITIPISWGLLKLYRRAVIRTMEKQSGQPDIAQPPPLAESPGSPPETRLTVRILEPSQISERTPLSPYQNILLKAPNKAVLIYLFAGIGYAAVMTWGTLTSGQIPAAPARVGIIMMIYAWPVTLAAQYISGTTSRRWGRPMILYWVLYITLALLAKAINPNAILVDIFRLWGMFNIPTTLVWWIVLNRRLGAISPLVLIISFLAVTGSLVMVELFSSNMFVQNFIYTILIPLNLGGQGLFFANLVIGFLVFCVLGWLVLSWIRWQYQNQKISEQIIILDALWLFFSVYEGVSLVFEGLVWALTPFLAFLVYKVILEIGFRWLSQKIRIPHPPCLLLLRVFSLGRRSEQLFDAISTHWRYLGNIHLIAGPDLATTTIEPHEFMDYVGGKLSHNFIDSAEKLETTLADCKKHPDHDSRFRVQEFFCYGDTWKVVLARLAETCDAVLMDLRGFSPQNAGCIFEINALIHHLPLDQVVFSVDETTNLEFLNTTIESAWENLASDSPNRAITNPSLSLFKYQSRQNISLERLLETLGEAASLAAH